MTNAKGPASRTIVPVNQELLGQVKVRIAAHLGDAELPLARLLNLTTGEVVVLETGLADTVELVIEGAVIARGEIVCVDDKYGVRITEIAAKEE